MKVNKVFIIAEAGVNHNGSVDLAKQLIDIASNSGADAVKFQTFKAEKLVSKNLYAATKNAFEMITNYYANINNKTIFYNIKFYESFGDNDKRKKIIPTIINNYKKNKTTKIVSKQLSLNIIHTDDIINSIMILLNNNITPGTYCIKNTNNIKISKLINTLNKLLNKKIKV